MSDPRTNAVVLSAGGVAGAFQAGALSVLLDQNPPSAIFGSSAGAINGAFLTDRAGRQIKKGHQVDWKRIADELVEFWKQNITKPTVLWRPRTPAAIATQICTKNFKGVLRTGGYRGIIKRQIDPENLKIARKNGIDYYPGVVNLFSGAIEYPDVLEKEIVNFIIASSAIPIAMDSVDIGNASFVDGGTRDVAPLSRPVEHGKFEDIICIVCHAPNLAFSRFPPRTLKFLMGRLMSIVINETVNNDIAVIDKFKKLLRVMDTQKAHLDKEIPPYDKLRCVTVIRPNKELPIDDMKFDKHDIEETIEAGVKAAEGFLTGQKTFNSLEAAQKDGVAYTGSFRVCWE